MDTTSLNFMCWNCRGIFSSIPYLSEVLRNNDVDICALSEHWLRSYQLHILDSIDSNFVSISKGVDESNIESLRVNDRSGVAFLVSKVIYPYTSVIDCNNSRFLGIEVNIPNCETFFAFCAYLPASSHSIDFFREHVEYMFELLVYTTYQEIGTVVLLGDFNTKINGPRYMFSSDQRSTLFRSLMIEHNLVSVNMEAICTGPVYCNRQNEISEKVKAIRNSATKDTSANWITFEFSEVHDICNKLKCNKACGHDDIAYEHLRFGGKLLMKHLCYLFNLILQYAYVPKEWHKSMIILLYKGDNKSRTDTNSYRGISLVPSITKVFEKLTDIKLSSIRTDFPNGQQVAYQKLLSSLNASFNLQEVTLHHIEKNGTIYIVLLDSTKAFDTVPHDGLRLKLHEYGAHGKLWLLLDSMYTNLYGAVSSNGKLSKWFELKRGIRQGSSLSAKLYLIFINDLINELESSKEGAFFHDLNASSPVQADDIAIIATNCVSTQRMVTICENYSNMWGFTFSPAKSKLLQFGKRRTSTPTYLYQEPINYVTSARHIGIQLDTSLKTMDRTLKACRTLRSTTTSVIRLGIHSAIVNPIVCTKIISQLCYPKALYGCKLWGNLPALKY
ncbi:unnamed protein product [Mytilus edulis]|uniref:Reverse transcriptase domain-containing protein n=1 Tax=Mytilus edulis TaxID=6550 RepID=A0A8S3T8T4_MYTED|nr:unnamed protein product [Mytilus edulis]